MVTPSEDSFVNISLDGRECEICLQDTGEQLRTCDICAKHLTSGPIQEGFNEIPALVHIDTRAHAACFRKYHKLARKLSNGSPKLKTALSPEDLNNFAQQWASFSGNNVVNDLLLENIRKRVCRSNPNSRSGSPIFAGGKLTKLKDAERCRSEPDLDSSANELHRSYTKYLFGKQDNRDDQSTQVCETTEEEAVTNNQVPLQSANPPERTSQLANSKECRREDSCPNNSDQYLKAVPKVSNQSESLERKEPSLQENSCENNVKNLKRTDRDIDELCRALDRNTIPKHAENKGMDQERSKGKSTVLAGDEWKRMDHQSKDALLLMSIPELKVHLEELQNVVNYACSQLVQLLQEKDVLKGEVASRHVTIGKLVQREKTLHP